MQTRMIDQLYRLHPLALMLAITSLMIGVSDAQEEKPDEKDNVDVATLMQEGSMALQSEDFDEAAAKFKRVTEVSKNDGMAWHMYGYALHGGGKLDEAIKIHKKAATFDDFKGISLYNLGCAYSLQGKTKESLKALHQCLDAKFDRLEMFDNDSDLVNVRKAKGFKAIANRVKNGGARPKFNPKKMIGTWNVKKGVRAGKEVAKERLGKIMIDKENVTIPAGPEKFVMAYKVNIDKRPAQVDMKITGGPAPEGSKAVGIIKGGGKRITLCYDPTGAKRPASFESTEENGYHLFVIEPEEDSDSSKEKEGGDDDDDDEDEKRDQKDDGGEKNKEKKDG